MKHAKHQIYTHPQTDHSGLEGAEALARSIETYWHQQGHKVTAWVAMVMDQDTGQHVYTVKTDMEGGLPK